MRRSARTILSLLILVFLMTSMGARGFNSKEVVHDLDHHGQTNMAAQDDVQTGVLEAGENPKSELLDEIEHKLLHSVSELHFLANMAISAPWDASARILAPASSAPSLPLAELDSPFRPPRSSAFI